MSTKIQRFQFVVGYDGTDFCGWAAQKGQRTVQSTLKEAVRQVSGEDCEILGASRTDSGAHARGQVFHLDSSVPIQPDRWIMALNRVLPPDVAIARCRPRSRTFHSRFSAKDRWYRYRILIGQRDPIRSRFVYQYHRSLDLGAMSQAAESLVGEHDFRAFSEELPLDVNSVREIYQLSIRANHDEIHIDVVGTAFVRGMMRRISGALVEIGRGKRLVSDAARLLDPSERDHLQWPQVLPAQGLHLMRVRYGGRPWHGNLNKTILDTNQEETDE